MNKSNFRRNFERKKGKDTITAIDLFSGAGGLSEGLVQAGFKIAAAVETDDTSIKTYRLNHNETQIVHQDIRKVSGRHLLEAARVRRGELTLLTGCPPCQGFSTLQTRRLGCCDSDPRNELIFEILRLTRSIRPRALVIENVPGLQKNHRFPQFLDGLSATGYSYDFAIVDAKDFAVPQRRKRLVLLAFRDIKVPANWAEGVGVRQTVRDAIFGLPHAGSSGDQLHDIPETRSNRILQRIKSTPIDGGSRKDVPKAMSCKCHSRIDGYHDVYGRMSWDLPSPTITSGCTNPSKGRFLHPDQDRAITLREAALLQSFPIDYQFNLSRGKGHVALQIGNAFPPQLIRPIAKTIQSALRA